MLNGFPKAGKLHNSYNCAKPFPHVVLRDVFDPRLLRKISREIDQDISSWKELENRKYVSNKFVCSNPTKFRPNTKELIDELQSRSFCEWIGKLTGYRNIISDPQYSGGGLHATSCGGRLEIHADFNYSKQLKSRRVVNFLLYLNDGWLSEWGGSLELWNRDMTKCSVSVPPNLGSVVLFNTDSTSYHGHPHPLSCPEGVYRKSIALYYYEKGASVEQPHNTLYQHRKA